VVKTPTLTKPERELEASFSAKQPDLHFDALKEPVGHS
jgi:hypothetical protein